MSEFKRSELKRVIVKPFDKDKFELVQEYEALFVADYKGIIFNTQIALFKVKIPAGYKTNGANIPRIFWSIYPPNSPEYLTAVVIHDYLCEKSKTRKHYKHADIVFASVLRLLGVNKFKIWVFYTACDVYHSLKFLFKRS